MSVHEEKDKATLSIALQKWSYVLHGVLQHAFLTSQYVEAIFYITVVVGLDDSF